jgi:hypothetical protein
VCPSRGTRVYVVAANWLAALGLALDALRGGLPRGGLAVEHLPNGTVLARDLGSGERWILRCEREDIEVLIEDEDEDTLAPLDPSSARTSPTG